MAKKKNRSSKKKKQNRPQHQKAQEKKEKEPPRELQTLPTVIRRVCLFALIMAGLFYLTFRYVIGGVALWKVVSVAALAYAYLAIRRQAFEASGLLALLQPSRSKALLGVGLFVLANGLGLLLFRFVAFGRPAEDLLARVTHGVIFVVSPVVAYLIQAKATTWASFSAMGATTQATLLVTALLYYYSWVVLIQIEKNYLPAKQESLYMLPV